MPEKKSVKYVKMPEVKYRKMRRDRERLLKLKALLRLAARYLERI